MINILTLKVFGVVGALSISRVHVVSMNHLGEKLTQYNLDPCYNTLGPTGVYL